MAGKPLRHLGHSEALSRAKATERDALSGVEVAVSMRQDAGKPLRHKTLRGTKTSGQFAGGGLQ